MAEAQLLIELNISFLTKHAGFNHDSNLWWGQPSKKCLESVEALTTYMDYEVLVVDNGSNDPKTLTFLAEWEQKEKRQTFLNLGPFNYSVINNEGVKLSQGVIAGLGGVAGYGHKRAPKGPLGYFSHPTLVFDVGAVAGACLLSTRQLWDRLGGLEVTHLKVAFNDVDYCLRAQEMGFRVKIWAPYAEFIHYESKSRGLDVTSKKEERL